MKPVGKPDAGNLHVRFDERGRETGCCHKAQATAPVLDSTAQRPPPHEHAFRAERPARRSRLGGGLSSARPAPRCASWRAGRRPSRGARSSSTARTSRPRASRFVRKDVTFGMPASAVFQAVTFGAQQCRGQPRPSEAEAPSMSARRDRRTCRLKAGRRVARRGRSPSKRRRCGERRPRVRDDPDPRFPHATRTASIAERCGAAPSSPALSPSSGHERRRHPLARLGLPPRGRAFYVLASALGLSGAFHPTPLGIALAFALVPILFGTVFAAVHAELIAHRLGEPYGTLVLTVAVTVIEVALIASVMLGEEGGSPTLARDTVFAVVMIVCNGLVGLCILAGAAPPRAELPRDRRLRLPRGAGSARPPHPGPAELHPHDARADLLGVASSSSSVPSPSPSTRPSSTSRRSATGTTSPCSAARSPTATPPRTGPWR